LIDELERQRGRRQMGSMLSLSPTAQVSKAGQSYLDAALAAEDKIRSKGLDPVEWKSLGAGVLYNPVTGESRVDENYVKQQEADYERRTKLRQTPVGRAPAQVGADGQPVPKTTAGERKDLTEWQTIEQTAGDIRADWQPGSVAPWKDFAINAFKQSDVLQPLGTMLEGAFYDPDQLKQRAQSKKFESDIIRRFAGTAVTGYELGNVKSWSPFAEGLTDEQARDRLDVIIADFARANQNRMNTMQGVPNTGAVEQTARPVGEPRIINGVKMQRFSDKSVRRVP